ncbi:MAG: prepilin-type N-terminal cleavage/methylation domain-containing protein [Burkholderiales bacterium]|nr:prepilin-type N-terminal cleavage/methylation domain-containing protein [Burkholderiales bacterium]
MPPHAIAHRHHGFSLIELLVALIVVSLGLGGILFSQARGMQALNGNSWRAQAAVLAEHVIDRARANPTGNYTVAFSVTPSGADVTGRDLATWKAQLGRSLPAGDGEITITPRTDTVTGRVFDEINVVVRWDDRRAGAGDPGSEQLRHMRVQGLRAQP